MKQSQVELFSTSVDDQSFGKHKVSSIHWSSAKSEEIAHIVVATSSGPMFLYRTDNGTFVNAMGTIYTEL